jgi:hypothetical protein
MGGKGRGVFSDFRMGRVGTSDYVEVRDTNLIIVSIPNQRARWKPAGCEEGQLVDLRWEEGAEEQLYNTARQNLALGGVLAWTIHRS